MSLMNIASPSYVITNASEATARSITITEADKTASNCVIYNATTSNAWVVAGSSSVTAVFPTSATEPSYGCLVGPGMMASWQKNPEHLYFSVILDTASAGKTLVSIKLGAGE